MREGDEGKMRKAHEISSPSERDTSTHKKRTPIVCQFHSLVTYFCGLYSQKKKKMGKNVTDLNNHLSIYNIQWLWNYTFFGNSSSKKWFFFAEIFFVCQCAVDGRFCDLK